MSRIPAVLLLPNIEVMAQSCSSLRRRVADASAAALARLPAEGG